MLQHSIVQTKLPSSIAVMTKLPSLETVVEATWQLQSAC
jgi:hypothetical protein